MEVNIPPKSDDPQRLIALNGVPKEFWLSALEINQMVNALEFLLGKKGSLYLDEHESLYKLELAHPDPAPGSYAQIVVVDGPNKKAEWDNTLKKWVITGDYDYPENQSAAGDARVIYFNSGYQSGLKFKVSAAWTFPGLSFGTEANPVIQEITLDAADAVNPRIDLIILNSDGTITKKTGIAGANPTKPDINPNTELEATFVLIPAGSNVPDGISSILVYNENAQAVGGEFNTAEDTGGARINLASVADFTTGAKSIEATKTKYYDSITFTPGNPITIEGNITELGFDFKNKPAAGERNIFFRFRGEDQNGNIKVKSLAPSAYDPNTEEWQFVSMSLAKLNFPILTSFELVANGLKQDDFGFFMDNVRFVGGTQPVNNDYVRFEDLQSYALNDLSNLVSNLTEAQQNVIKQKLGIVDGAGSNYLPPAPYADIPALFANQGTQVVNETYRVTNAAGWSTVDVGRAWFTWLGTTTGTEADYEKRSEEESMDLDQQFAALQSQITDNANRLTVLESIKSPITKSANFFITAVTDGDGKNQHLNKIFCTNASAITATIPNDATENIAAGFETTVFWTGAGGVSFAKEANVILNIDATELAEIFSQYNAATLIKRAANTWIIVGALKKA